MHARLGIALACWSTAAIAQTEPTSNADNGQRARIGTDALDAYTFDVPTCDGVRAQVADERPRAQRSDQVLITLRNTGAVPCAYTGVSLKGWLAGMWDLPGFDGDLSRGFSIAPGASVRLRVRGDDPNAARGGVQLQIPPGKGYVVLIGAPPAPPPADAPSTPAPPAPTR
jgi:hypothetical protein